MPHNFREQADSGLLLFSPAKLNLFLRVTAKRPDGYHELLSLMQAINFGDSLSIKTSRIDSFTCSDSTLPMDGSNLVCLAVQLFRTKTQVSTPLSIHLEKRIPRQAGLGGGSSNAATTLWGLNALFNAGFSNDQLMEWGAELGPDVPFFFSTGRAFCQGRGEKVTSLPPVSQAFRLFHCPIGATTPEIFKHCTPFLIDFEEKTRLFNDFHYSNPNPPFNDLESITESLYPEVAEWKKSIPCAVTMTGSGSSYFTYDHDLALKKCENCVESVYRSFDSWYY